MSYSDFKSYNVESNKQAGNKKKDHFFFTYLILPNIALLGIILIWAITTEKIKIDLIDVSIIAIFVIVITSQILIIKILKFYTNMVYAIDFETDHIILKFKKKNTEYSSKLTINYTDIELNEVRNYKSFIVGIQIIIRDKISNVKYRFYDNQWSSLTLEEIYKEYKKRKKEDVLEDEKYALQQLQFRNKTYDPKNVS